MGPFRREEKVDRYAARTRREDSVQRASEFIPAIREGGILLQADIIHDEEEEPRIRRPSRRRPYPQVLHPTLGKRKRGPGKDKSREQQDRGQRRSEPDATRSLGRPPPVQSRLLHGSAKPADDLVSA
jgi:hypothetical protein